MDAVNSSGSCMFACSFMCFITTRLIFVCSLIASLMSFIRSATFFSPPSLGQLPLPQNHSLAQEPENILQHNVLITPANLS